MEQRYKITTEETGPDKFYIDKLRKAFLDRYGKEIFTKEEFIEMYMDYTGCGPTWAEKDFSLYSKSNARVKWLIQL